MMALMASMKLRSQEVRRGDLIVGRTAVPEWTRPALVIAARWHPTHLSLDLRWIGTGKVVTGCALSADEEFTVERVEVDPIIESARASFADYCRAHDL
jgi:hypothetical protein